MVATSAAGCRKGGLPKMVRCRESPQGESIRNQCARKSTNQKASWIQPGLNEHGPSDVPTTTQNLFPTSSGLPIESTAQNELDTPHTLLFFLESERQLQDRMRAHGRIAPCGPRTKPRDERKGARGIPSRIGPRKNPSGERGVARDAKYIRVPRDPAQDKVAAARWSAVSSRMSPEM